MLPHHFTTLTPELPPSTCAPRPLAALSPGPESRPMVAAARRLVIKLGTRVLTDGGDLATDRLRKIIRAVVTLRRQGREVLLVSSGAVGLGRALLGLKKVPEGREERQVCAAVGQSRLMAFYQQTLQHEGQICAQLLLTEHDFHHRSSYLRLRQTLDTLLKNGVVPVLNENDAVTFSGPADPRPVFGDNDRLAALVAAKLGAELLVLLTDVPGVFAQDPRLNPQTSVLPRLDHPKELGDAAGGAGSTASRGGMRSKVAAAFVAARGGCQAVIVSGLEASNLERAVNGEPLGTWFPAHHGLRAHLRWIGFAAVPRGVLHLDAGAVVALVEGRASLLPVGVHRAEGNFERGDVVELRGPDQALVGRGVVLYHHATVKSWCHGNRPTDLRHPNALIRRSHLVLEQT